MLFRSSNTRRHRRYSYLQCVTFFSLGPEVAGGSRRAVGVDLSDAGICVYTPDRLQKGQVIIFNNPLPVPALKATVRWVKEYRMAATFYKAGLFFLGGIKDDIMTSFVSEDEDPENSSTEKYTEQTSSVIESLCDFEVSGKTYRKAPTDDFWSDLADLPERETEQLIALSSELMLHEATKDYASLRFIRASAFSRKAAIIFARDGRHGDNSSLELLERSLADFRAGAELASGEIERLSHVVLEETLDAAAKALDRKRPGRSQEILGKTKLAYLGNRLHFSNSQYAPSGEEMEIFGKIFFHYPRIVRSAEIFYKPLGEAGKRYINVVLYEEASPPDAEGELNGPLCIISLVEDGTFHLIKDFTADRSEAGDSFPGSRPHAMPAAKRAFPTEGDMEYEGWDMRVLARKRSFSVAAVIKTDPNLPVEVKPSGVGRPRKRNALILVAGSAAVLLLVTAVFMKIYQPKPVSEPGKEILLKTSPVEAPKQPSPPSDTLGSRAPAPVPGSSGKLNNYESKMAAGSGRKKRSDGIAERPIGPAITDPGSAQATRSPKMHKRSFKPPSRDDL